MIADSPHRAERGATLIETMIASTLFAALSVAMVSAGSTFSQAEREQFTRTTAATSANVVRTRVLADAEASDSVLCADASTLSLTLDGGSTVVEYYVTDGDLVRWALPPDKESLIAENVNMLACQSFGPAGLVTDFSLGTLDHPHHVYMRVSDSGAVP